MKKFLAVYIGTPAALERSQWNTLGGPERKEREKQGIQAWMAWADANPNAIVDMGAPLGKTKQVSPDGTADIKNTMVGYTVIEGESHEAVAKLFEEHPHFTIFPGDSVEIMECLPMPGL